MIDLLPMEKGEEEETFNLVERVFRKHVAPIYSENGVAKFLSMLSPNRLIEMMTGKSFIYCISQAPLQNNWSNSSNKW